MRYTFKQLEYFVAVAECGSIAGASEKVHVSSPSISVAIAQLEEALAVRLFVRQPNGLQLTEIGSEVLIQARSILEKAQALHDFGSLAAGELRGKIALGCLVTLAPLILPEICKSFSCQHPAVTIELIDGSQDQLIGYLRRGVIDVAVTYEMHIPPDLWFEPLVGVPPLVMMDENHRFAKMSSVSLKDLESDPYILLDIPISRDYFMSVFNKTGVTPNVRMKSTHFEVVRTMVANGQGISIGAVRPINEAALDGKRIISIPISNPIPVLNIGMLSRRSEFSNLASALKKHIQEIITPNSIPGMRPLDAEPIR
jgi:DNA-binding transcriptional LysR family regulator